MLGHLRCSTLQGQLQEKRRQGKNLSLELFSKGRGEGSMHAQQAGSKEWGRCEVKQRRWPSVSRVGTKYTCSPHACCQFCHGSHWQAA